MDKPLPEKTADPKDEKGSAAKIDNRYEILKVLGSGLSGEVLAVSDEDGKKALKTLKKIQLNVSKEEALGNFKNEFAILTELNHPNIAKIHDYGFDARISKYYFTSELIEGKDFFAATQDQSFEVIEDLVVQTLRALNYLHSRGIYHLDIKPQNILVAEKGGKLVSKIIDFGLAGFTAPRKKVGTPAYMAPEIIIGGTLDGRTDLYSFGVMLYKVLSRENPFASKDLKETLERQRSLVPAPPSKVNPSVPPFWDQIVMRLLEKNPVDRYPQGAAVIRDINFLANKNYEIETMDTRLSYLPEKGALIGRKKEVDIFKNLFDLVFIQKSETANKLLLIEGKVGTGKSRLLSEFKYHSQLSNVPVYNWKQFSQDQPAPPFVLQVDDSFPVSSDQINSVLQQFAGDPILIIWATQNAPVGWSHCEKLSLRAFSEEDLSQYLTMVTGLKNPPQKLAREIYQRSEGNPLFVTELIRTLLSNNLLLDSSGRWASTAFEDIGINFDKIQVSQTLTGLIREKYLSLGEKEKEILEWMAILNRATSLETIKALSSMDQPQSALLYLTKEDIIERTNREYHYFFNNILMRDVIFNTLELSKKRSMHDKIANYLSESHQDEHELLYHKGHGLDDDASISALQGLAQKLSMEEKFADAVSTLEEAFERAATLDEMTKIEVESMLAEITYKGRYYPKAKTYFEELKSIFENSPNFKNDIKNKIQVYERLGDIYAKLNEYDKALEHLKGIIPLLTSRDEDRTKKMLIENHIANVYMKSSRIDEAEKIFLENYVLWENTFSDDEKRKITNNWLTDLYILKQDYDQAKRLIAKNLKFFEELGNNYLLSRTHYLDGDLHYRLMLNTKDKERTDHKNNAILAFEKSLAIAKAIDAYDLMLRSYNGIGNLHSHEKEYDQASDNYQRALAISRKLEDFQTAATISLNLGGIYQFQQKYRDAYSYFVYSINTFESLESKGSHTWIHLFNSYIEFAETCRFMKELTKAEEALTKAEDILKSQKHMAPNEFWIHLTRAKIYNEQSHTSLCRDSLTKAEKSVQDEFQKNELTSFKESIRDSLSPEEPEQPKKADTTEKNDILPHELENILQINKFINAEHNPEYLFKMVLNFALDLTDAESGIILLLNDKNELDVRSWLNVNLDQDIAQASRSVAYQAIEKGEVVILSDALSDDRFNSSQSIVINELKSILCVPLKSRNKIIGVLYLDNKHKINAFQNIKLKYLHAYSDQVGIALENTRLINELTLAKAKLESELHQKSDELEEVKEQLKNETSVYLTRFSYSQIITKNKAMLEVLRTCDKITETSLAVFIHGASGTGKELIARAIHVNNMQRNQRRFIAINCAAIPENLIESELFGHKRGAFTGATSDKKGLFEEANGGTLFLDEIGDLPLNLQVKLLRVLQEGEVMRVGDTKSIKVDTRIVSASHKNLEKLIEEKKFREDLYYRLCQIKLELPQLRDRKEDIPHLVDHFIEQYKTENKIRDDIKVSALLMKILVNHSWPGNIRELENVIQVACALKDGNTLTENCLPKSDVYSNLIHEESGAQAPKKLDKHSSSNQKIDEQNNYDPSKTWADYEKIIMAKCYAHNKFNKTETASMLDVSLSTFYQRIKQYELDDKSNPLYKDRFVYQAGLTLQNYIPKIFRASLATFDNKPYTAIKKLEISQGYFYKMIKLD